MTAFFTSFKNSLVTVKVLVTGKQADGQAAFFICVLAIIFVELFGWQVTQRKAYRGVYDKVPLHGLAAKQQAITHGVTIGQGQFDFTGIVIGFK